ncbi:MAG TPA: hypothetical protein VF171_08345 [Trueperaceae bacterium]
MKRSILLLLYALLLAQFALAQNIRSLGMGGVITPGTLANPAYAALPSAREGFTLPLPLGVLNVLVSDRLDVSGGTFDLLSAFDQGTHLSTFLFNPARSPEEVVVSVRSENGVPTLSLKTVGGSTLLVTQGVATGYRQRLGLPVGFDLGGVRMAVRPYLNVRTRLTPDDDLSAVFGAGTSSGSVGLSAHGEAGVALDVLYAAALPIPRTKGFPAEVYVGVRASPFVGLARLDAVGSFTVAAVENAEGQPEFTYAYQGSGFGTLVGQTGLGYGLRGDVGMAVAMEMGAGRLTAGLDIENLGVSSWSGYELVARGDDEGDSSTGPVPAHRTYVADDFGVGASFVYDFGASQLGIAGLSSLRLVADAGYRAGALGAHLGGEAGFDAGFGRALVRAGLGYDGGLVLGVGTGLRLAGVGFDLALHGYRSPFTAHEAFGLSAGMVFGY